MGDELKTASEKNEAKGARVVKVNDEIHVVVHKHTPARRFDKIHVDARVEKVHEKGKFVDLVIPHEDPDQAVRITKSPRDDAGTTADTWHFPEGEPK